MPTSTAYASGFVTHVVLANQNAIRALVMDLTFFFYTTCLKCLNIDLADLVFFFYS